MVISMLGCRQQTGCQCLWLYKTCKLADVSRLSANQFFCTKGYRLINVSKGAEVQVQHLNDVDDGLQTGNTVSMHRRLVAEQLFRRKDYGLVNISKCAEDRMQNINCDLNAGLQTVHRMPMQGRLVGMQLVCCSYLKKRTSL